MVAVGDQELAVGEELAHAVGVVKPPQAGAGDLEVGWPLRLGVRRSAVVEEEDRLELRLGRAQKLEPTFFRTGVRPLVRQHLACGVRRRLDRARDALTRALYAVGAGVGLLDPPERRLFFAQHASLSPRGERLRCRLGRVGQRQMDDVVRTEAGKRIALLRPDHVVRRRDQVGQVPGARVVAKRAKRREHGHDLRLP